MKLDRPGIFKARPTNWSVYCSPDTAVALCVGYQILAQLENNEWTDWSGYEPHYITGYHFVIKRDGTVNETGVHQCVESLGWSGDLRQADGDVPDVVVQINCKEEEYNGRVSVKVGWLNPGDYTPQSGGADAQEVAQLQNRFGSLLRAAASAAGARSAGSKAAPAKKASPKAAPKAKETVPPHDADDAPMPWETNDGTTRF